MKPQHIFFIMSIGVILLVSGCIGGNSGSDSTPTPSVAVTHIPTFNHPATPTPGASAVVSTGPVETFDINGTVRDYVGNPEANAIVTLMQNGKKVSITGVTNPVFSSDGNVTPTGYFIFQNVPEGTYQITAEKGGFKQSAWYSGYERIELFLPNMPGATPVPTKLAGPTAQAGGYVCSFVITRASNGDVVITNDAGPDQPYLTSVKISFIDNTGNVVTPQEPNKLGAYGVTGDLFDQGAQCTISKDYLAPVGASHIYVVATFNKPPAPVSSQIMASADV